jgi:hypothetical protein
MAPIMAAYCTKVIHRFIIFVHFKSYRPSSMLSHRQNSHASSIWKHTSRQEAGNHERVNRFKNVPVVNIWLCPKVWQLVMSHRDVIKRLFIWSLNSFTHLLCSSNYVQSDNIYNGDNHYSTSSPNDINVSRNIYETHRTVTRQVKSNYLLLKQM